MIQVARPAFFFATLGIGLGGLWAYLILDWGGYWAWDPVETGSLLPWICLVMLLHLRTKPGKTSDHMWAGVAMASGALGSIRYDGHTCRWRLGGERTHFRSEFFRVSSTGRVRANHGPFV